MMKLMFPPTKQTGDAVADPDRIASLELVDYNEFYRLYTDGVKFFVEKLKNPVSAIDRILKNDPAG